MRYEPRTIAFVAELFHPPIAHDGRRLQALHNELFADARASYRNFTLVAGGASLSNPVANPTLASAANLLADRVQVREEGMGVGLEEFCARLETLARLAVERVGIPVYVAEQATVRSLVNPRRERDARVFLGRDLFRFPAEALAGFGRDPQLLGLRAVFPATPEEPATYALRVESYNGDPRSLYIEAVGTFPPIVPAAGLAPATENVRATYRFLTERALPFVECFDV